MKTRLGAILVQVACVIAEYFHKTEFANLHDTVILTCQLYENAEDPRWRHGNLILSSGVRINVKIPWYKRLQVIVNKVFGEYNLQISNVSINHYGIYWCEMQINKTVARQKVLLVQKAEKKTSTLQRTVLPTLNQHITSVMPLTGNVFTDEREMSSNGNINSTPFGEETSVIPADNYINYIVFAVGFAIILCVSIACNFVVSFCRKRSRKTLKITQRTDIHTEIGQSHDDEVLRARLSDDMSNVSSRYESIDENRMITLDRKKHQTIRNDIRNFDSPMESDNTYLEVVGDYQSSIFSGMHSKSCTELCLQNNENSDVKSNSKQSITTNDLNQSNSITSNQNILTQPETRNANENRGCLAETTTDSQNQYVPLNRNELCHCQSYSTYENQKTDNILPQSKPSSLSLKRYSC